MKLRFRIGTVKVASVQKGGKENIIRPLWLFDCIKQNQADAGMPDFLLPLEPRYASSMVDKPFIAKTFFSRHMFFTREDRKEQIASNVDRFMDSYARDTTVEELKEVCNYRTWHLRKRVKGELPAYQFKDLESDGPSRSYRSFASFQTRRAAERARPRRQW